MQAHHDPDALFSHCRYRTDADQPCVVDALSAKCLVNIGETAQESEWALIFIFGNNNQLIVKHWQKILDHPPVFIQGARYPARVFFENFHLQGMENTHLLLQTLTVECTCI